MLIKMTRVSNLFAAQSPVGLPDRNERRILLIGKTGAGKIETGNTILGGRYYSQSVTRTITSREATRFGKKLVLIDIPGMLDTIPQQKETEKEIAKCIEMTTPGLHAFLLVIRIGWFIQEEIQAVEKLADKFGPEMYNYLILVFTGLDGLEREGLTFEIFIETGQKDLAKLLQKCANRYLAFNNVTDSCKKKEEMAKQFVEMVEDIFIQNKTYYPNEQYIETERQLQEKIKLRLKEKERKSEQRREEMELIIRVKYAMQTKEIEALQKKLLQAITHWKASIDELEIHKLEVKKSKDTEIAKIRQIAELEDNNSFQRRMLEYMEKAFKKERYQERIERMEEEFKALTIQQEEMEKFRADRKDDSGCTIL